jgi:hypothetical protein
MTSLNPGVSAAGAAAGRTARNPAAGQAAIGGMLHPGENADPDLSDLSELQVRLSSVVSDVAQLASAIETLTLAPHQEANGREGKWGREGEGGNQGDDEEISPLSAPSTDLPVSDESARRPTVLGTVGGFLSTGGDCSTLLSASPADHRHTISRGRS